MEKSDEDLVADYHGGNAAAFETLVTRHMPAVYSFAARMAGRDEASDIVQSVFLKVWKSLHTYRPESSQFKTWLMRIARNATIDVMRKKKMVAFSSFDTEQGNLLEDTLADTSPSAEEVLHAQDDARELAAMLGHLSPDQREVIVLYHEADRTFGEIAQIVGVPENTAKSRYRRGLIALRDMAAPGTDTTAKTRIYN